MGFLKVFEFLSSPLTTWMKGKQEMAQSKQAERRAISDAKIQTIKRGDVSDISMDQESRGLAGWMDDISFYVFLSPAVLAFFPPALPHVTAGFAALESMPQWWQAGLGMMLVSVWGYRKLVSPIIQSIAKAWLGKQM